MGDGTPVRDSSMAALLVLRRSSWPCDVVELRDSLPVWSPCVDLLILMKLDAASTSLPSAVGVFVAGSGV